MSEPAENEHGWDTQGAMGGIDMMYAIAGMVYDQFLDLAAADPVAAATQMQNFLERARDIHAAGVSQEYVEAISGGPNPDYMIPIINLIGRDYPDFPKEIRRVVINALSDTYAGINFQYVRWLHTPKICSPEILRDFCLEHDLFFPDLSVVDELITRYDGIDELAAHSGISELTVAMWLTRPLAKIQQDMVPKAQAWRDEIKENKPGMMEGAMKVLGALDYQEAFRRSESQNEPLDAVLDKLSRRVDQQYLEDWRQATQDREDWLTQGEL